MSFLSCSTEACSLNSSSSACRNLPQTPSSKPCRSHTRPPPIVLVACHSPTKPSPRSTASPSSKTRHSFSQPPVEPLDSPAFLKGDLNFPTFRERAARAIAEWGPSPTGSQFPSAEMPCPTPRRSLGRSLGAELTESCNHALRVPVGLRHSASYPHLSSPPPTPFTPLTPGPHTSPQHRAQTSVGRPSSMKLITRPRPSPLQLPSAKYTDAIGERHHHPLDPMRSVRFADGSPLRGSTWHITQYPQRLASPPISAANLTLADLVELEAIKQSLGTWCGEIMGSPMRGSFNHSSANSSASESDGKKSWTRSNLAYQASDNSPTSSPTSCTAEEVADAHWLKTSWPESPGCDSDCDSEIFEGMH